MSDITGLGAIRNLDYTVLLCHDIEAMRGFYTEVMGFEVHHEIPGRWVELQVGSSLVALRLRGRAYDGPRPATGTASVQFAFRVPPDAVEVAAAQLAEHGIEILEAMTDLELFGHRTLFFADPEDNVIEIYAEI